MQMQEHVGQHAQRAVARRVVVLVAEDRSVDLGLGRIFQALDLFLGLGGHVGLERLNVFLDARRSPCSSSPTLPFFPFVPPLPLPLLPFGLFSSAIRSS